MKLLEHDIIQNIAVGALALHKFTSTYFSEKQNLNGPALALALPVLPIVFHESSLASISTKRFEGGFFNALNGYRELPAGLQQRMQDMANQTFKSLNLAYQSKILTYSKELNEILPIESKVPISQYNSDIKEILHGAERLGYWFAKLPLEQICINLKITF
ncbi:MAG: three component ABC system middle component [Bacteroidota bacterium]